MQINDILIKPIITEKSTMLKEGGYYTFKVNKDANKLMISQAVEAIYKVKVIDCKVLRTKPKVKMLRTRRGFGKTATIKKAMVRLEKGQTIPELEA